MYRVHRNHAANVRIVTYPNPFDYTHDVIVQVLKDDKWVYFRGFNSFSNDYAFGSAHEAACEAMQQHPLPTDTSTKKVGKMENGILKYREYEAFISDGASLFPLQAYVAYEKGACGDDVHAYGATPEEAIENLRELIED